MSQTAWQIGVSESQRQAIYRDPAWQNGHYPLGAPPRDGLSVARQVAMVWYRSQVAYVSKFGREQQPAFAGDAADTRSGTQHLSPKATCPTYAVEAYLEHQGRKFNERFDANSYVSLTRTLDSHSLGRRRGEDGSDVPDEEIAGRVQQPVTVIGIDSDVLYPLDEQRLLAAALPRSKLGVVHSAHGHDGFLLELAQVGPLVREALESDVAPNANEEASPRAAPAPRRVGWAFAI